MIKNIDLHEAQWDILMDPHRFKVVCAGRRWGKSTLALAMCIKAMVDKPNAITAIVAPTYQQAKDIYWRDPMKIMHYVSADSIAKKNDSELFLQFKNGSYLYLRGSDRPDTLRGLRFDFVVLDEYAQMKSNVWEQIIQPTLLDSKGSAIFISTPYGYDKFYKLWMKGQKESKEWRSWRFTSYENPHNDPKDLNKWRAENDEDTFAQEYLAEFKKLKGLVYKDFHRSTHVIEPKDIPLSWSLFRGIDFGFVNPTAIIFAAISPEGEIIVFDEIYMSGLRTPDIADLIKQRSTGRSFVNTIADSAQRSDIEELQKYGIALYGVSKSTGSRAEDWITYKIRRVAEKLRLKKLFIFNTCTNLIFEFENYKYHEVKEEERVKEIPLKVNDHALDALSYLITSLPERIDPQVMPWDEIGEEREEKDWSFA